MIKHLALAALMFSATASAQQIYDLLIKGGQVIDPADHKQGRFDVAVIGKRIARVDSDIPAAHARVVVEADGYYVTPGLIDINTHVDIRAGGPNVYPDYNALRSGVTTVVDAGSSNAKDFEAFKSGVIDRSKTRVLAFLNGEPDAGAAAAMVEKYPKVLVGLKISDASAGDSSAFKRAMEAAVSAHIIVMIDSTARPDQLEGLRPGDIYTRIYRQWGQPAGFESVTKSTAAARRRGVLFDVGAGSDGLWFSSAAPAIREGLLPDTISTGMEKESMLLPGTNMSLILSKFLNLGLTFDQMVERTTVNAARAIRHSELGSLGEGSPADLALFQIQQGKFGFLDSGYTRLNANKRVACVMTIRDGEIVWDTDGLAAEDWVKAGPYSNFK
jgi:dihydroorotase